MFRCTVEIYGLPQNLVPQNRLEVELEDDASLKDVVAALKRKVPGLEGPVIEQGQDRLLDNYAFAVNGQFQTGESNLPIHPRDKIVLVLLATGG